MIIAITDWRRVEVLQLSGRMVLCRDLKTGKRRVFDASEVTVLWGEHR